MKRELEITTSWMKIGGIGGILSIVSYLGAAFLPVPDTVGYVLAFAFGPLVAIGGIGLYHGLSLEKQSPLIQIAAFFWTSAGVTVLSMLTVQQAIFAKMEGGAEKVGNDVHRQIFDGLNAVHYGLDIAWDVLISTAVILFGIAMLKHPKFGRIIGGLGILFGSLLLGFNLYWFPNPPINTGSIDWGPAVALWMVAAYIHLLRAVSWGRDKVQDVSKGQKVISHL